MTGAEWQLVAAALAGIAVAVLGITKARLSPFIGLLCGALVVGMASGMPLAATLEAIRKGLGDILAGTGLVVALGLTLGAMLHLSNGARTLADAALGRMSDGVAPWASLFIAMLIGLPLFFETGLVLLLPVIAAAAASLAARPGNTASPLSLFLPALTGLSVVHALVPPHPGPVLAVSLLGANLGRTMAYGLLVAVPTAIISGPLLARFTARGVAIDLPVQSEAETPTLHPAAWRALVIILLPIVLIGAAEFPAALGAAPTPLVTALGNPVLALLITNLVALPLLFGAALKEPATTARVWSESMHPAGAILLAIGAGGALKQVLVSAGMADLLSRLAASAVVPPLLLAWLASVGIRLATGSATVATITAAGVLAKAAASSGIDPAWFVLAIGSGSVFFSHVNDPGFWLVKSTIGMSTPDTFRTWSALETAISVVGLAFVLLFSMLLA